MQLEPRYQFRWKMIPIALAMIPLAIIFAPLAVALWIATNRTLGRWGRLRDLFFVMRSTPEDFELPKEWNLPPRKQS